MVIDTNAHLAVMPDHIGVHNAYYVQLHPSK